MLVAITETHMDPLQQLLSVLVRVFMVLDSAVPVVLKPCLRSDSLNVTALFFADPR